MYFYGILVNEGTYVPEFTVAQLVDTNNVLVLTAKSAVVDDLEYATQLIQFSPELEPCSTVHRYVLVI